MDIRLLLRHFTRLGENVGRALGRVMSRVWWTALVLYCLVVGSLIGLSIAADRAATLYLVENSTHSLARLFIAHAEGAMEDAEKSIAAVRPLIAAWDKRDPDVGRRIFERLRRLPIDSPQITSAWIVDQNGDSLLNTLTYPSKPASRSGRQYYKLHLAGAPEPVIAGQETGVVTNQPRFTISRAIRSATGQIEAIIVVGIYSRYFESLYQEAADWPEARAGLFLLGDDQTSILARMSAPTQNLDRNLAELSKLVRERLSGAGIRYTDGSPRVVGWHRSTKYNGLFAATAQSVSSALADWWLRSIALTSIGVLSALGFAALAILGTRAGRAERATVRQSLLLGEVHHRVKNNLQIVASLIEAARRQPEVGRDQLTKIAAQVRGLAALYDILQTEPTATRVDVNGILDRLCTTVARSTERTISFSSGPPALIDADQARHLIIIINELLTNSIKHAARTVTVTCESSANMACITVADDGPGLAADFDFSTSPGFGLRLVQALADAGAGSVDIASFVPAVLRVRWPLAPLEIHS